MTLTSFLLMASKSSIPVFLFMLAVGLGVVVFSLNYSSIVYCEMSQPKNYHSYLIRALEGGMNTNDPVLFFKIHILSAIELYSRTSELRTPTVTEYSANRTLTLNTYLISIINISIQWERVINFSSVTQSFSFQYKSTYAPW